MRTKACNKIHPESWLTLTWEVCQTKNIEERYWTFVFSLNAWKVIEILMLCHNYVKTPKHDIRNSEATLLKGCSETNVFLSSLFLNVLWTWGIANHWTSEQLNISHHLRTVLINCILIKLTQVRIDFYNSLKIYCHNILYLYTIWPTLRQLIFTRNPRVLYKLTLLFRSCILLFLFILIVNLSSICIVC